MRDEVGAFEDRSEEREEMNANLGASPVQPFRSGEGLSMPLHIGDTERTVFCRWKSIDEHCYGIASIRPGELHFRGLGRRRQPPPLVIRREDIETIEIATTTPHVVAIVLKSQARHLFVFSVRSTDISELFSRNLGAVAPEDIVGHARKIPLQRTGKKDFKQVIDQSFELRRQAHWFDALPPELYPNERRYEEQQAAGQEEELVMQEEIGQLEDLTASPAASSSTRPLASLFQLEVQRIIVETDQSTKRCSLSLWERGMELYSFERGRATFTTKSAVWSFEPPVKVAVLWRRSPIVMRISVRIGQQPHRFEVSLPTPDEWGSIAREDAWKCTGSCPVSIDVVYGPYSPTSGDERRTAARTASELAWLEPPGTREIQDALQKLNQPQTESRLKDRNNQLSKVLKGAFCRRVISSVPRRPEQKAARALYPQPCLDTSCSNLAGEGLCLQCKGFLKQFPLLVYQAHMDVFSDLSLPRFSNQQIVAGRSSNVSLELIGDIHRLDVQVQEHQHRLQAMNDSFVRRYRAIEFGTIGTPRLPPPKSAARRRRTPPWPVSNCFLFSPMTVKLWIFFIFTLMTVKYFVLAFSRSLDLLNATVLAITE